jgi:16S rRNA processing protein RimM
MDADWLEIGTIVAPQGLRGEVRVYPNSDFPDRFQKPGQRWLLCPQGLPRPVQLTRGYAKGNIYVVKLEQVDSREQATNLRGCKLLVPRSDRPKLAADEYHVSDLISLPVYLQSTGQLIGRVVDILTTGHDLLQVALEGGGTVLIPFVQAIVPVVDLPAQRLEISPPAGLLDLVEPSS